MNSRELIRSVIAGKPTSRCGFWLGCPHPDTWPILHEYFGTSEEEELRQQINDDLRWVQAGEYKHPEGKPVFDYMISEAGHGAAGAFADTESVQEIDDFDWPNPDYLDFSNVLGELRGYGEVYRASGFWSSFFHDVAFFFGMENYFMKMCTHPEVVHAATRHVVDFYLEANKRFFSAAEEEVDGFFFGNDFGTQLDLLVSPDSMREFVLPYFRELVDLAHDCNRQVLVHSCGAIHKIIPDLIDHKIDVLHPLQALASNMDAETLSREFNGKIAYMGGIDTQQLLVHATPEEIVDEVRRVKGLLGPSLIVSPSHETLLPNVPPQNVEAMAQAALEA